MLNAEIDTSVIVDTLEAIGLDEDALYRNYSGRGMFGATCFGIEVDAMTDAFRFFTALPTEGGVDGQEMAGDLAEVAQTDNLGMGAIVYFPGWELA